MPSYCCLAAIIAAMMRHWRHCLLLRYFSRRYAPFQRAAADARQPLFRFFAMMSLRAFTRFFIIVCFSTLFSRHFAFIFIFSDILMNIFYTIFDARYAC